MSETEIQMGDFVLKAGAEKQTFETGAQRDMQTGKGRFDLIPPYPLVRLSKIFEAGAVKYGNDNWAKGMPLSRFWDSAHRHLVKYWAGLDDEDHLGQALWNIWCLMTTEALIKTGALPASLQDLPSGRWESLGEEILRTTTPPPKKTAPAA